MRRLVRERLTKADHFRQGERVLWMVPTEEGRRTQQEGTVVGYTADACIVKFRLHGVFTVRPAELDRVSMSLTLNGVLTSQKKFPEAFMMAVGDTMLLPEGALKRVR